MTIELTMPKPIGPNGDPSVPPDHPVQWKIVRLKGAENPNLPPIVSKDWYVARAYCLVAYNCGPGEVELRRAEEASDAR